MKNTEPPPRVSQISTAPGYKVQRQVPCVSNAIPAHEITVLGTNVHTTIGGSSDAYIEDPIPTPEASK
jgi:hypothetical protein